MFKDAKRFLCLLGLVSFLLSACGGVPTTTAPVASTSGVAASPAGTSIPSNSLQVTGQVKMPGVLKLADIQALPKITVTTNPQAGNGSLGSHTYGGALLYTILQKAQIITNAIRKNDLLRRVVLVTGTDGYAVAVSLAEMAPRFANKQIILAYEEDGQLLPAKDGFVRLIIPGDRFAGRYVSNIASIRVEDAGTLPTLGSRVPSSALYLVGLLKTPTRYDLNALKALKMTEVTVQSQDQAGNPTTTTYSGVLLSDLLQDSGGIQLKASKNDILRKGVVAIGTDGYSCIVVGGEIDPRFAHTQILVAISMNGQPLASTDGFARLVVPGDQAMGRFVSNLTELQVVELGVA